MFIKKLNISNFRNYDRLDIELSPKINIIYGSNGSGKTNLLESIYVLGLTKSHRISIDDSLIKNDSSAAHVNGIVNINKIDKKFSIGIDNKHKKLEIDNNLIKKVSDYVSEMNIIIFYPEDLNLIKGSPSERRRFLNLEISQLTSKYLDIMNDYNRLLKMRNECLKQEYIDETYLQIITNYIIDKMVYIYILRKRFIDRINETAPKIYKDIIKLENFKIVYNPSIKIDSYDKDKLTDQIKEEFKKISEKERQYHITLIGPNRDDFDFYLGDINLKEYGSQGQQRVGILAIKLAEINIIKKYKGEKPILLLDDVFSELDDEKKNNLLKYIKKSIQTIITTTELNSIDEKIIKKAKIIHIEKGIILDEVKQ